MAEVFESVIKIETGDSEQSVKGLKKQINDLRDHILNLEKGTDEYNDAVAQLMDSQRRLDEVMSLTKKTATALDGSYDALAHQMALLRKEWKATNDEARRNELGKQIDELNDQLKELDGSIGNFQRNVGNYPNEMGKMSSSTNGAAVACKSFQQQMSEMNEQIEPTKQKFEAVSNIASGLAAGFAVVQGAAALLGEENEDLQKTFVKLQAAMAMMQGLGGLKGLVEGFGRAKVAFASFGKVLGGTGGIIAIILAVVAAVGALIGNLDKLKQKFIGFSKVDEATIAAKKFNEELTALASQSAAEKIYRIQELSNAYKGLGDNLDDKKKFVAEFASELSEMGIQMNNVNDADRIFIQQTEDYKKALIARAKADAVKEKATEDYKKALEEQAVLETKVAEAEAKRNAGTPDKSFWENLGEAIIMGSNSEKAAPIETNTKLVNDWTNEIADENVAEAKKALRDAKKAADDAMQKAFDVATGYEKEAEKYLTKPKSGNGGKGGGKQTKTADEIRDELLAKIIADTEKELLGMDFSDEIILDDVKFELEDNKGGQNAQFAKNSMDYNDRVLDRQLALNDILEQTEEDRYARQNELLIANEQKKLDILKEFQQRAIEEGDWQSQLSLQQDIADQEVAIQVEKNRQIVESEERRKEEQIQIMNEISSALSAAGAVMNGISEIYQANAEEDGEITKEEANKLKNLQYATATINMLQGAITAFSSAMQLGPIAGPIVGGVNAAAVIAMGTANLMKIKNTDLTSGGSGSGGASVTPANTAYATELPATYTRQITGASEIDALNGTDQRVYILESDIQASNKRVQVRESESSF